MPLSEEQGVPYSVAGEILKFLWGLSGGGGERPVWFS